MQTFKQFFMERKYWGREAAGTIFVAADTGRILFLRRSGEEDSEQGQWEITIGGRKDDDDLNIAVTRDREAGEELGVAITVLDTKTIEIFDDVGDDHEPFRYTVFLKTVPDEFTPKLSDEHDAWRWAYPNIGKECPTPLHFGAERLIANPRMKDRFA